MEFGFIILGHTVEAHRRSRPSRNRTVKVVKGELLTLISVETAGDVDTLASDDDHAFA